MIDVIYSEVDVSIYVSLDIIDGETKVKSIKQGNIKDDKLSV